MGGFVQRYSGLAQKYWVRQQNMFVYYVIDSGVLIYVKVSHRKKDIIFNTVWDNIEFGNIDEAKEWCLKFNHLNFTCKGKHAKLPLNKLV